MLDIEILGSPETEEGKAAILLKKLLETSLPENIEGTGKIIVALRVFGRRVQDIDLLLILNFEPPFPRFQIGEIEFKSLICTIEVKNVRNVTFHGDSIPKAKISHASGKWDWPDEQSHEQKYALKNHLEGLGVPAPYIQNFIWFQQTDKSKIPQFPKVQYLPDTFSSEELAIAALTTGSEYQLRNKVISGFRSKGEYDRIIRALTSKVEASEIDIDKINEICAQRFNTDANYINNLVNTIVRGAPGTGKTIFLLSVARYLYQNKRNRILILTYNRLLVMDIVRLSYHLGISDAYKNQTIQIQTVHSFILDLLKGAGLHDGRQNFLDNYETLKQALLKKIQDKTITIDVYPSVYSFDRLFIDEGQDWPDDERDILYGLYGSERFIISAGTQQLIRAQKPCNWAPTWTPTYVDLRKIMRSKRNIVEFINLFARKKKLDFSAEANFPGGKVKILMGKYTTEFHKSLSEANGKHRNFDMLYLVPPSLKRENRSLFSTFFEKNDMKFWDTTSKDNRVAWPTSLDAYRIVPYDSCRGLEGTTVVCIDYNAFVRTKNSISASEKEEALLQDENPIASFIQNSEADDYFSSRWSLIPFSRAIETLVIQLHKPDPEIYKFFKEIHNELPHAVEWHESD